MGSIALVGERSGGCDLAGLVWGDNSRNPVVKAGQPSRQLSWYSLTLVDRFSCSIWVNYFEAEMFPASLSTQNTPDTHASIKWGRCIIIFPIVHTDCLRMV